MADKFDAREFWDRVVQASSREELVELWNEFKIRTNGRKLSEEEYTLRYYLEPRVK